MRKNKDNKLVDIIFNLCTFAYTYNYHPQTSINMYIYYSSCYINEFYKLFSRLYISVHKTTLVQKYK